MALLLGAATLAACLSDDHNSSSPGNGSDSMSHHTGRGADDAAEVSRPVIVGAPEVDLTADALTFTPKTLHLAAGRGVNVVLTSVDVEHDLFVEGIGHVVHAAADETTRAGLEIDEPGTYPFWCTVEGHRAGGMVGTVTVT